jgi:hypothetical protein
MAIGSYGTIRPSDVSPEDVQIIMNYTPSRDVTDNFVLTQLDAQTILNLISIILKQVETLVLRFWVDYII